MIHRRPNGQFEARCDRCLVPSPFVDTVEELAELLWELRADTQTWCPDCSRDARTPKGRPNARGVVRRRRAR